MQDQNGAVAETAQADFCDEFKKLVSGMPEGLPFIKVPAWLMRSDFCSAPTGLSPRALGVYVHLIGNSVGFGDYMANIIRRTSWSRQTVRRSVDELETCGLVTRVYQGNPDKKLEDRAVRLKVHSHPLRALYNMRTRAIHEHPVCGAFLRYVRDDVLPRMGVTLDQPVPPQVGAVERWNDSWGFYARVPGFFGRAGISPRVLAFAVGLVQIAAEHDRLYLAKAARAVGCSPKVATEYAEQLRATGLLSGYPNLYREDTDSSDPAYRGRIHRNPFEVGRNLTARARNLNRVNYAGWQALHDEFAEVSDAIPEPEILSDGQNPPVFGTYVPKVDPPIFGTYPSHFWHIEYYREYKDKQNIPKSLQASLEGTFIPVDFIRSLNLKEMEKSGSLNNTSWKSPAQVTRETAEAWCRIIDPVAVIDHQVPAPCLPAATVAAARRFYASTLPGRYGPLPEAKARYSRQECVEWLRSSRILSTLQHILKVPELSYTPTQAVRFYRQCARGLCTPAMLDRLLVLTDETLDEVRRMANKLRETRKLHISSSLLRQMNLLGRRRQFDWMTLGRPIACDKATQIDSNMVRLWMDNLIRVVDTKYARAA